MIEILENEKWKPIKGFEGYYEISNMGRVKSLGNNKKRKEKILKPRKSRRSYLQVVLCKDGKRKMYSVHRLVANAFIKNPNNLGTVNHIDYDKTNNKVSNLEWMSIKDNVTYSQGKSIKYLDLETNETKYFLSISDASRQLNISESAIHRSMFKCKSPYKNRYIF